MKRFRFGLEKVLELREHREHEAEIELGKAVGILNSIDGKIAAVTAERDGISAEQRSSDILNFDRYILRLNTTKAALLVERAEADRKVEEVREVYLALSRDRKVISNLKDRRQQEYRKFVLAEETKALDDIASSSKARKLITNGA
jgi:flagellar FliJ protein